MGSLKTGEEVPVKLYRDGATIGSRIKIGDPHYRRLKWSLVAGGRADH
jgi:hypothetical protein